MHCNSYSLNHHHHLVVSTTIIASCFILELHDHMFIDILQLVFHVFHVIKPLVISFFCFVYTSQEAAPPLQ